MTTMEKDKQMTTLMVANNNMTMLQEGKITIRKRRARRRRRRRRRGRRRHQTSLHHHQFGRNSIFSLFRSVAKHSLRWVPSAAAGKRAGSGDEALMGWRGGSTGAARCQKHTDWSLMVLELPKLPPSLLGHEGTFVCCLFEREPYIYIYKRCPPEIGITLGTIRSMNETHLDIFSWETFTGLRKSEPLISLGPHDRAQLYSDLH